MPPFEVPPAPPPPNRTLSHFYTSQTSLLNFLPSLFPPTFDLQLLLPEDPPAFHDFLSQTLVCLEPGYQIRTWNQIDPFEGTTSISEILNRAIVSLFKSSKDGKPSNQLTNGFTSSSYGYSLAANSHATFNNQRPGIYSKHVNTNNLVFSSKRTWGNLVERIGPGPFYHLLTTTSIFLPLPNECFSQITGTPMIDLQPFVALLPSADRQARKRKRAQEEEEEEEKEYWGESTTTGRKKKKKRRRTKPNKIVVATPDDDEEEEDAEMLDADVEMELSMSMTMTGDASMARVEEVKKGVAVMVKKSPKSRRESIPRRTPADITFARNRMFYARSVKKAGRSEPEKRIVVGLGPNHILSLLQPSPLPIISSTPPPSFPPSSSLTLLKYIFPLQFNLHNVFTSSLPAPTAPKSANVLRDYTSRKEEIEARKEKKAGGRGGEGKRVKGRKVRELVEELWRRHGECDYWKMRAVCCASKVVFKTLKPSLEGALVDPAPQDGDEDGRGGYMSMFSAADTTLALEFVSQPPVLPSNTQPSHSHSQANNSSVSLDPQSQIPFSSLNVSHDSLVLPQGLEPTEIEERKKKQKFKNFTQSCGQVCRFATSVVKKVVPLGFFGSESNRNLILRQIETFITLRRFESLSLHAVLQGFSILDCSWLEPENFKKGDRISAGDASKRREILQEFIYWLFDSFLIPLLKTTFYITESAAFKKQVLYFRQDDWDTICKPLFHQLQTSAYEQISKAEILRTLNHPRQLGHSYVRLLPKENGVRPLINLKRAPKTKTGEPMRDVKGAFVKSINATLKETFSILVDRKESDVSLFGASILGADDIYPKLKEFKRRTAGPGPKSDPPPYFFVKVDVRSCFDTIDQTKLMEILEEILEEDDDFNVLRFNKAKLSGGQVRKKFLQKAFPSVDSPTFPELADKVARKHHREILMDKAFETSHEKEDTLRLLREHVTDNLIKIGPKFFRQAKGIPQGSIVSTHLCSFFYADLERRYLGFTNAEDCMLIRLVDDFLLITTNKDKAVEFVRTMHRGHPRYGCFVSREKTLMNFECRLEDEDNPSVLTTSTNFPWCGRLIDTRHLHVKGDYSRDSTHIKKTLTVNTLRHPGLTIRAKVFRNIAQKSSICFNDTTLNTPRIVYLNIYQNLLFCAMKTVWYVKELSSSTGGMGGELGNGFLLATIKEAGEFTFNTVRNGARSKDAREQGGEVRVEKNVVMWLTHQAFLSVFATKPTLFRSLILSLRLVVEKESEKAMAWKGLLDEGWAGMKGVRF